jgi:hypothetical protein
MADEQNDTTTENPAPAPDASAQGDGDPGTADTEQDAGGE